jgi:putative transposase
MRFDPDQHHRHSIRLPRYDYSRVGGYFVTLCTADRECLLGSVAGNEMNLVPAGLVVAQSWKGLPSHYPHVALDLFVVMPNHLHGILHLGGSEGETRRHPLSEVIRAFKAYSAKRINVIRRSPGSPVWQRNFYERVIRDEAELERVRGYIVENPVRWSVDRENPDAAGGDSDAFS